MIVEEIMTPSPATVDISASVGEVISKLLDLEIHHMPVISNGEYIGMISDPELRNFAYPIRAAENAAQDYRRALLTKVSEIVNTKLPVVHPEMEVVALIDVILEAKSSALAVVDPVSGELLGIVTYVDVIKAARMLFDA
jgi:CBS domain-containing protein